VLGPPLQARAVLVHVQKNMPSPHLQRYARIKQAGGLADLTVGKVCDDLKAAARDIHKTRPDSR
jgi:hypothetical protein